MTRPGGRGEGRAKADVLSVFTSFLMSHQRRPVVALSQINVLFPASSSPSPPQDPAPLALSQPIISWLAGRGGGGARRRFALKEIQTAPPPISPGQDLAPFRPPPPARSSAVLKKYRSAEQEIRNQE